MRWPRCGLPRLGMIFRSSEGRSKTIAFGPTEGHLIWTHPRCKGICRERSQEYRLRPYIRLVDGSLRFPALMEIRSLCPDHESGIAVPRFPQVRKGSVLPVLPSPTNHHRNRVIGSPCCLSHQVISAGRGRRVALRGPIGPTAGQQDPSDAGHLIGQGHGGTVDTAALDQLLEPKSTPATRVLNPVDNRPRSVDQQGA